MRCQQCFRDSGHRLVHRLSACTELPADTWYWRKSSHFPLQPGLCGLTEDSRSLIRDPLLYVCQDFGGDLLICIRRGQTGCGQTGFLHKIKSGAILPVERRTHAVLLGAPFSHPVLCQNTTITAQSGGVRYQTNRSRTSLSVLITYSTPSSTGSRLPLVMITAISMMISVSSSRPMLFLQFSSILAETHSFTCHLEFEELMVSSGLIAIGRSLTSQST